MQPFAAALAFSTLDAFDDIDTLPAFFSGVYALLDEAGDPIYVGQSKDVPGRVRTHKRTKKWKSAICSVCAVRIVDPDLRLVVETLLFLRYRPRHNRAIKLSKRIDGTLHEVQFLRFTPKSTISKKKVKKKM